MKTAEEWASSRFDFGADTKMDFMEIIKAIQADALTEASELREAAQQLVNRMAVSSRPYWEAVEIEDQLARLVAALTTNPEQK